MNYTEVFNDIENNKNLLQNLEKLINQRKNVRHGKEQYLSSIIQIILKNDPNITTYIESIITDIKETDIQNEIIKVLNLKKRNDPNTKSIIYKLYNKEQLSENDIELFVSMSLEPNIYSLMLTTILNLIKFKGLDLDSQYLLSLKMAESGKTFDYRNSPSFQNKKLLRRYPTGGVSEKIALIMPALLKCLTKEYDFVSPFLVAKTLSFTGGTWDKLSSIPNFSFPDPGLDSINLLSKDGVCMTVAHKDYNPSDTNLYQLRSITNTVDSLPLIITSIASKQIANPVDTLMLDVRYGKNAFLKNLKSANSFFDQIKPLLRMFGIDTIAEFTETNTWYGSSVGNYLEVIESICLMRNVSTYSDLEFDSNLLDQQKTLVIKMTAKLIAKQFSIHPSIVEQKCINLFANNNVYLAFKEILKSHGVCDETIFKIDNTLPFTNTFNIKEFRVNAHKNGIIEEINQKNIGSFVNIKLQAGSNFFKKENRFLEGVLLLKPEQSIVQKGETLALVFSTDDLEVEVLSQEFFKIN
ncbi:hypothetical protein [Sphingobacterium sp. MYb388]|uniref:hypothetical protein n=1 Tax=Sphingobacterium sp. MYb388 TaxID=2745437 RepID=UPI0030A9B587